MEGCAPVRPPIIESPRLLLRPFAPDDFEPYYERILSDPAVMRFLSGDGTARSRPESLASFARVSDPKRDPRDQVWATIERASGQLIGHSVLQRLDKTELIEVGYALGQRFWGNGFATEAAQAVVKHGFETLRLELIVGVARPENAASRRVLEKTGLTYNGLRRYYNFEVAYYELTRGTYEEGRVTNPSSS